jgi:hypothetical protein
MAKSTLAKFQKALAFRKSGATVLTACKKADLAVPTFYYKLKQTGVSGRSTRVASAPVLKTAKSGLTGTELKKLRMTAARIQKLGQQLEKLLSRV